MTFCRKENIPVFMLFTLCVLHFEILFVCFVWGCTTIYGLILNIPDPGFVWELLKYDNYRFLWVTIFSSIWISICQIKSAVTKLTINHDTKELTIDYYSGYYIYLKRKELTIPFSKLDYVVVNEKKRKTNIRIFPFLPSNMFIFYRDDRFLLRFGCTIGWTPEQFKDIEDELRKIVSPRSAPKGLFS